MSKIRRNRSWPVVGRVRDVLAPVRSTLGHAWRALRRRPATPIEVLLVDRGRRRTLERQLGAGLRRLERLLPAPTPGRLAVVVQHTIAGDRPLVGQVLTAELPDGTRSAVLRVALVIDGRRLTPDELLAALCDQWLALAGGRAASGVRPLVGAPDTAPPPLAALPTDPLLPWASGPAADRVSA